MSRILVVDDDPDVVEAISLALKNAGHEVSTASDKSEGMASAGDGVDLLVLDCMMEEADDGLVMARELRNRGFGQPILMLSSINKVSGLDVDRDEDVAPVDAFAEKPIAPASLVAKVDELLSKA